MYPMLVHAHSGLRWLVLLFLLLAIFSSLTKWQSGKTYTASDKRFSLMALIFTHVQLILGLVLYFISPKVRFSGDVMGNSLTRFYTVEHMSLMLIAIVLITIGYSRAKRAVVDGKKFKSLFWYYSIGLLLILVSIPWPFRNLGAGWF